MDVAGCEISTKIRESNGFTATLAVVVEGVMVYFFLAYKAYLIMPGPAVGRVLTAAIDARRPDSQEMMLWNQDRLHKRLTARAGLWTSPPDLVFPRIFVAILTIADSVAWWSQLKSEITSRGYQIASRPQDSDLMIAVLTEESSTAMGELQAMMSVRSANDDALPLLVLWCSGPRGKYNPKELLDVRDADLSVALNAVLPHLRVLIIGYRGDETAKVRSVAWTDARLHIEKMDDMGQFAYIQTSVGIGSEADGDRSSFQFSSFGGMKRIQQEIDAEAEAAAKAFGINRRADQKLPLNILATPPALPGSGEILRRAREINLKKGIQTWKNIRNRDGAVGLSDTWREPPVIGVPRIFIAYRWENILHEAWVEHLAGDLHDRGYDIVFDRHPQHFNDPFGPDELLYRIAECTHFAAIVTKAYVEAVGEPGAGFAPWAARDAVWARREWEKARTLNESGFLELVSLWRSGPGLPISLDPSNVLDLRHGNDFSKELDRKFPHVLIYIFGRLQDGQVIKTQQPIRRSDARTVVEEMQTRFNITSAQFYAASSVSQEDRDS